MASFSSERFRVYVIADLGRLPALEDLGPRPRVAIQLRDREASGAALFAAARRLVEGGHRVYVNDRLDVALAAGCEGVHLGGGSLTVAEARTLGDGALRVGCSTHSVAEVAAAREQGADFCALSPIFATPGKGPPVGLETLREASGLGLPVYALGGVDGGNAAACLAAGAHGVAAIRAGLELAQALALTWGGSRAR